MHADNLTDPTDDGSAQHDFDEDGFVELPVHLRQVGDVDVVRAADLPGEDARESDGSLDGLSPEDVDTEAAAIVQARMNRSVIDEELDRQERERQAELEALIATHWIGTDNWSGSRVSYGLGGGLVTSATSKRTLVIIGVVAMVLVLVVPMFFLPHLLASRASTATVVSDLREFAKYKGGQSADMAAVQRVTQRATQTTSGAQTVWAEWAGGKCWGVVASSGSATSDATVAVQSSSLCR